MSATVAEQVVLIRDGAIIQADADPEGAKRWRVDARDSAELTRSAWFPKMA